MRSPNADATEAPVAIVCEFGRPVADNVLAATHRLAWNFSRTPLLVTVEPHLVRTWTCCEPPDEAARLAFAPGAEIQEARLDLRDRLTPSEQAAHALHWIRLVSGEFYGKFADRFRRDGRADRILLEELTRVRRRLGRQGLDDDTIHDLLARIVFIQFLFDRKDADGRAALNPSLLARLHAEKQLLAEHDSPESILADHAEAYRFFRWLNTKFNGDLFPGKGRTEADREAEWRGEMGKVGQRHLTTLADFVGGCQRGDQRAFWRQYSFDIIPLEFISSIYEEFVTATGAHYTPGYLVDFMLDGVLPWEGDDWDLRILDPACGSGIFLVKAYQRLIQRWKDAHPEEKPSTAVLRRMLERNLFGVDIDPHAVRVASFSLYLTMCDEIDPKTYLKSTKFPRLRGTRLVNADFFREDLPGLSTAANAGTYDLVVGNAPWGRNTETDCAREWASGGQRDWPIPDNAFGTLFVAKAASLTSRDGRVSMIQPASSLLFNRGGPAVRFREKLFSQLKVEEIVNLATLRIKLFQNADSPLCIVTLQPIQPGSDPIVYISPKEARLAGSRDAAISSYAVIVEPHDIAQVWPREAVSDPAVWAALAWGGRRGLALVHRLAAAADLQKLQKAGIIRSREGVIRGDRKRVQRQIVGRRILEGTEFPPPGSLHLDPMVLPVNDDACTDSKASTDFRAFEPPQMLIKQGWTHDHGRFRAVLADDRADGEGVICSQSYLSVHVPPEHTGLLESAVLTYNSMLAVSYLLLTSGRLAAYRAEPLVKEMRGVPLAKPREGMLAGIASVDDVDRRVREEFGFKDAEWVLVEDLFRYTMPDFKGDDTSPGRQPTSRNDSAAAVRDREPHLHDYCTYALRVLRASFGDDKGMCATVYQDPSSGPLPVRLVAVHLDWKRREEIIVEPIESHELCKRLLELDDKLLRTAGADRGGVFFQRVARVYDTYRHRGREIPTVYIVKPDRVRYWTRSAALRDADEVVADMHLWRDSTVERSES
jgi:hypothetical protein